MAIEWDSSTDLDGFFVFFPQWYRNEQWLLGVSKHAAGFKIIMGGSTQEGKKDIPAISKMTNHKVI